MAVGSMGKGQATSAAISGTLTDLYFRWLFGQFTPWLMDKV